MFSAMTKVPLARARIVINATRAKGGVRHESQKLSEARQGEQVEVTSKVTKHVDHEKAVLRVDQAVRRVIATVKKFCKSTPMGWVCPEDRVPALESELQSAFADCAQANSESQMYGSERRVQPSIVYAQVDWNDPSITKLVYETLAERVAETVDQAMVLPVERLTEIRQELLLISGMVGGPAREALEFAARDIPKIAKARRDGADPDLDMLKAAVSWFTV